jgi:hypothetical protein
MGCGSFCWFRSGRLAYWKPDVGRGLCQYVDLRADNAEPFFKNLLKERCLDTTGSKRIGQKKGNSRVADTLIKRGLAPTSEAVSSLQLLVSHKRLVAILKIWQCGFEFCDLGVDKIYFALVISAGENLFSQVPELARDIG